MTPLVLQTSMHALRAICSDDWHFVCLPQVEARGLKPNTKFFYQFRYRANGKAAPVRAVANV